MREIVYERDPGCGALSSFWDGNPRPGVPYALERASVQRAFPGRRYGNLLSLSAGDRTSAESAQERGTRARVLTEQNAGRGGFVTAFYGLLPFP